MSSNAAFIIGGQSLGGFYSDQAWKQPTSGCYFYNYLDQSVYPTVDPLPGWAIPTNIPGSGGSIWSRLCYLYGQSSVKPWDGGLLIAPAVEYGSSSQTWIPGSVCFARMMGVRQALVNGGWAVRGYLWINGETDGFGMIPGHYTSNVNAIVDALRASGDQTPFIMAVSTTCRLNAAALYAGPNFETLTPSDRVNRWLHQAQIQYEILSLAGTGASRKIYLGANHDLITSEGRHDGCHLNSYGQMAAAEMWLELLLRYQAAGIV